MSHVSETIRKHHRELMDRVTAQVEALADGSADADAVALVSFLKTELGPHADGESKNFYPAIEPLIKAHGQATATMQVDHHFIADYIGQLEAAVEAMNRAGPGRDRAAETARRLALKLEAILELHLEKEEQIYLPLFDSHLSEQEQRRIVDNLFEVFETD
jgi:hemerythrin-like domain-containing protein